MYFCPSQVEQVVNFFRPSILSKSVPDNYAVTPMNICFEVNLFEIIVLECDFWSARTCTSSLCQVRSNTM